MTKDRTVLLIEDDESLGFVIKKGIESRGFEVVHLSRGKDVLNLLRDRSFLAVFLDIMLPDANGLGLLAEIHETHPTQTVVVMTAQTTMKNAIEAMRLGAYDYLAKPFDLEEVYYLLNRLWQVESLKERVNDLETRLKKETDGGELIGSSGEMQKVYKIIGRSSATDHTVLITGESGTGKELVARAIHQNSSRSGGPFVSINCAAIPRELLESELFGHEKGAFTGAVSRMAGRFETANRGTLFLDEIGDMGEELQAKLLRVLEEKELRRLGGQSPIRTDVRIIAATHRELQKAVREGEFREDLFHRLNVIQIELPPLRQRPGDIPELVSHFLRKYCKGIGEPQKTLTDESMKILSRHSWSGNVRELENVIKRAIALCPDRSITPDYLPPGMQTEIPGISSEVDFRQFLRQKFLEFEKSAPGKIHQNILEELERELFRIALEKTGGNQIKAASLLGIHRNTLHRKLDQFGIRPKPPSGPPDG